MQYVRMLEGRYFMSDGSGNNSHRRVHREAGTICLVIDEHSTVYYVRPADEGCEHLWIGMGKDKVEPLTEMQVIAEAAAGNLSFSELEGV